MSVTITEQPFPSTVRGQKLVIMASSTNVTNDGFKFKVVISDGTNTYTFRPFPNPANRLIIDIKQIVSLRNAEAIGGTVVHFLTDKTAEPVNSGYVTYSVNIYESWLVAGVLTDDPGSAGPATISALTVWNATNQPADGYKLNPNTRYAITTGQTVKRWLSDRNWDTHTRIGSSTSSVYIPVRETDYGVLDMLKITATVATKVSVTITDSSGTPHAFTIALGSDFITHLPLYPANLNASATSGWLHPSTYPGWKYISIVAQNVLDQNVGVTYILYNVDVYGRKDCKNDNVRLGWRGFSGGWDYQNFTKRNEETLEIQRKKFLRQRGNYIGTSYSEAGYESGLIERDPIVERNIEITSDFFSEQEFYFLRSLLVSNQVHWIHDDGTFDPIVVETNNYKMPRERNGKLKTLSLKIKLANDLWT